MGVWGKLKNLFGGDAPKAAGGLLAGVMMSSQLPRRGTRELILAYKRLPWLHTGVRRIAHDVAAIPFELYRPKRKADAKSVAARFRGAAGEVRRKMLAQVKASGEMESVFVHPFLDTLAAMNPALPGMASHIVTQQYIELAGETFWVKELNGLGLPVEYWPVPPHWMLDLPHAGNAFYRASYLGWQRSFPENAVRWIRHADPENPYGRGVGTGTALGDEMDIDEAASKHLKNWFFNGSIPPAIVNYKGMGEDELKRTKEKMVQEHRGPNQAHKLLVSNADEMTVEVLGQTFKDQEINELRRASRDIFLQVLNIPPELVGIVENSNRATIDSANFLYSSGVLCPRKDFLVSALQPELDLYDDGLVLGYVSPVPEDREFKQKVMVAVPAVFTIDEHRALAGAAALLNGAGVELYKPAAPPDPFGAGPTAPGAPAAPAAEPAVAPAADEPAADKHDDPPWAKTLRPQLKQDAIGATETVLESLRPERLTTEVDPVWRGRLGKWGQRVLNELGVQASFSMRNPLIADHLERFSTQRIQGLVDGATREALRAALREGVYAGEGIDKLSARVADTFEFADKVRARRIARTEVVSSSNFANVEAFKQSGVVAEKEWLTTRDGKARDTHKALDGSTVRVDQAFVSEDGDRGQYPGGFSKAANCVNCRCSALPKVEDVGDEKHFKHALVLRAGMTEEERGFVWKRYDKRLLPWEKQAAAALRRGFRAQERDVLEALEKVFG